LLLRFDPCFGVPTAFTTRSQVGQSRVKAVRQGSVCIALRRIPTYNNNIQVALILQHLHNHHVSIDSSVHVPPMAELQVLAH